MTPEDVYETALADNIRVRDDCWLWAGATKKGIPRYKKTRTIAYANLIKPKFPYRTTCWETLCVHPEHVVEMFSEFGRMIFIQEHTQVSSDGCHEWTGKFSRGGSGIPKPVFSQMADGEPFDTPVRRFNWCVEYLPPSYTWPEGTFRTACGNPKCVRFDHIDAVIPHESECVCAFAPARHHRQKSEDPREGSGVSGDLTLRSWVV